MNAWHSEDAHPTGNAPPSTTIPDRSKRDTAIAYRLAQLAAREYAAAHPARPDPGNVEIVKARIRAAEARTTRALPVPATARQRPADEQIEPDRLLRGLAFGLGLSVPLWAAILGIGWAVARGLFG